MNIYAIGYPCSEGFAFVNVDFTRVNMQIVLTCSMDVDKATFYIRESAAFKALERLKEIDAEGILVIVNDEDYDDEFLIEKSHFRYLPDEVGAFLNLYETVARPGSGHCDVTCFFMANAISWTNPYFLYFDVLKPMKKDKNKNFFYPYKKLFSNPKLILFCLISAIAGIGRYGLLTWIPTYFMESMNLSIEDGIFSSILLPIGQALAMFVFPFLTDKLFKGEREPMDVKVGDVIAVKENKRDLAMFKELKDVKVVMPKWLEFDANKLSGKINALPQRDDIDLSIKEHLIIELYSKN